MPQLAIWWYLKHGIAMELGRLRSYTHWQLSCSLVVPCVWSTFVLSRHIVSAKCNLEKGTKSLGRTYVGEFWQQKQGVHDSQLILY